MLHVGHLQQGNPSLAATTPFNISAAPEGYN